MAAGQAKIDATRKAEELAARLSSEQEKQKQLVAQEFSNVKTAAAATDTRLSEVKTEVAGVNTKVDSTKSELDKTIADLSSTRGDLGVQSGLIATNAQQLAALKALGERNYFEFDIRYFDAFDVPTGGLTGITSCRNQCDGRVVARITFEN